MNLMYQVIEEILTPKHTMWNTIPEKDGKKSWFKIKSPDGSVSFSAYLIESDAQMVCNKKNSEIPCTQG